METVSAAPEAQVPMRRVFLATLVGTTIEWYDYLIYGTTAALVFNQLFFPNFSPLAGTLAAFASFAVGFFARPLGGIIFGHFGDRVGRKGMLFLTLLLMGGATFLIGLLPTFQTIGVWAPILLVALRLVQGLGLGGEWGGAALIATEHAPSGRRGFFGSSVQMGAAAGLVISSAVITISTQLMSDAQFLAWGWRIPFLVSILLVVVAIYIRLQIPEPEVFTRIKEANREVSLPIIEALRLRPKNILLMVGITGANNIVFYVAIVYTVSYATSQLGLQNSTMTLWLLITGVFYILALPAFGALSDYINRRRLMMVGAVGMAALAFPYFWLLNTGNPLLILLAMVVMIAGPVAAIFGPQPGFFPDLFETQIRYSGISLGYNLTTMIFGGLTPFIATALFAWLGGTWAIAMYVIVTALISVASLYIVADTAMIDSS